MEFPDHPQLGALVQRARERGARDGAPRIGIVYPGDALALDAAARMQEAGLGEPLLIGPRERILRAADAAGVDAARFEIAAVAEDAAPASAAQAVHMARQGAVHALMKGSLHTDELMSAVVNKEHGLRGETRISHAFVFDLPRYPGKLLALADCVVNIAPHLAAKRDIVTNAVRLLQRIGVEQPRVGIVAAVESVNPAIPATVDAQALVAMQREQGLWPGAIVEGPFGFDNAFSAEAARIKGLHDSQVAGQADLLIVPDLNAGNMLYKSFVYVAGGECAGLVLGATVPIVLTSRADSLRSRLASVALAGLAARAG